MNDSVIETPAVWAVSDGAAGNARQATALACALGSEPRVFDIAMRNPWRWLAPRLTTGARAAFASSLRWQFAPPWPDIVVGCGRQAALLTRMIRQWSAGKTVSIQILDPRVDPALFDIVVAPKHDALAGPNVIQTIGSLNPVDDDWLKIAADEFSTLLQLPSPRTAFLIGGPRSGLALDAAWLDAMIAHLQAWLVREGGSVLIAASRRTPPEWMARLRGAFDNGCAYFWASAKDGPNPYAGYLALADRIVVTPDSVNMLSEACATGKPVFTLMPANARGKLGTFHAQLRERGSLRELDANNSTFAPAPPLRETATVAAEIRDRMRRRAEPSSPTEIESEPARDLQH